MRVRTDWIKTDWLVVSVAPADCFLTIGCQKIRQIVEGDGKISARIYRLQLTANHAPARRWKSHHELQPGAICSWGSWPGASWLRWCELTTTISQTSQLWSSYILKNLYTCNVYARFMSKVCIFWEGHKILRNLYLTLVYGEVKISRNFVVFSEYMNFTYIWLNNQYVCH